MIIQVWESFYRLIILDYWFNKKFVVEILLKQGIEFIYEKLLILDNIIDKIL